MKRWQIWVDTGGTFTDCLAQSPENTLFRAKVLSSSALRGRIVQKIDARTLHIREQWHAPPDFVKGFRFRLIEAGDVHENEVVQYRPDQGVLKLAAPLDFQPAANSAFEVKSPEEAPVLAARLATATSPGTPLPPLKMRLGTTRGTNALLERHGAPTALFITEGFADLLRIGTQQRPDLFALEIRKPEPYFAAVVEVPERLDAQGEILRPLELAPLTVQIDMLKKRGITAAAIALMHSYRNPRHEKQLAAHLRQAKFEFVSCSSDLAPFIKILPRAETTVINAYLGAVIHSYLRKVQKVITDGTLHVMTSAGGLVQPQAFQPKDSLLSGPAGGVVGAAHSARRSGFDKIIAFDMGGTSTDACRFDGDFEYIFEHRVGEAQLVAPALAIESVAAGGGSICWFDGQRSRVGPESAGAFPGPACYGAGGPLSITDVNLLLGRLRPQQFEIPIEVRQAEMALRALQKRIAEQSGSDIADEVLLTGFLEIANERMAGAIRSISVRKGYDPADYALLAFGGAGGQHACAITELLGIQTIVFPRDASLLSAFGIGHARIERFASKQVLQPFEQCRGKIGRWCAQLAEQARAAVEKEGVAAADSEVRRTIIHLRFAGQESSLAIDFENMQDIEKLFLQKYQSIYGYLPESQPVEVESLRVIVSEKQPPPEAIGAETAPHQPRSASKQSAYFAGEWRTVPVYQRQNLAAGAHFAGPALVFEQHSALVIYPHWRARVDAAQSIVLEKTKSG